MISEEIIEKVKESNDIVDIISESVALKRAGRSFIGLCPFHNEKTPSFSVSQDKQIYKCFGCGEAGNVITFVMKNKNMTFVEAVKYLAEKANIEIQEDNNKGKRNANEILYKVNVEAARYYFNNLRNNKMAVQYFANRGIENRTIRKFGLGYAKEGWRNLINFLKNKGYTELDLLNAGLIIPGKNNSYYDRFRNRVIFPVFDYRGRVIGFGARVLDDSKPKYLNSPETNIFKKGTNLYGLNFAIKDNKERTIIIVEGYMDCISLHQHGITNVVASLGTALTIEQAKLLKKYADKIIVSYDSDLAGQSATIRGLKILKKEGFDLRVLVIPKGKDPDEFIKNYGKDAFNNLINESLPFIDYLLKMSRSEFDIKDGDSIIKYIEKACNIISDLDSIEKALYIKKLSEETGIKEQAIYDLMDEKLKKNVNKVKKRYTIRDFGQKLYLEPAYMKAERNLLKIMTISTDIYQYVIERISEGDLILESHKKIFILIKQAMEEKAEDLEKYIEYKCDDVESSKEWIKLRQVEIGDTDSYKDLINEYLKDIKKFKLEESKKEIMNKIKHYETQGLYKESLKLVEQLDNIQKEIIKMNNYERR